MTKGGKGSLPPKSPQAATRQQTAAKTKETATITEAFQVYDDHYGIFFSNSERQSKVCAGFLGPTSYSAIFSEHQSNLGVGSDDWSQELRSDAFQDPGMPEQSSQSRTSSFINLEQQNDAGNQSYRYPTTVVGIIHRPSISLGDGK
ncbi:MAG: hypothetical protein Q9191_005997 [Dirinaria sp. TL-2023a]